MLGWGCQGRERPCQQQQLVVVVVVARAGGVAIRPPQRSFGTVVACAQSSLLAGEDWCSLAARCAYSTVFLRWVSNASRIRRKRSAAALDTLVVEDEGRNRPRKRARCVSACCPWLLPTSPDALTQPYLQLHFVDQSLRSAVHCRHACHHYAEGIRPRRYLHA
eukprot:COSAG02_NODE_3981_length_5956_cov_16.732798_5_plen_163_part_00